MGVVDDFRRTVLEKDVPAILATLSPDITFHSPVMPKPYRSRAAVAPLLTALAEVFEDFAYTAEFDGHSTEAVRPDVGSPRHALQFTATVDGKSITGMDVLATGDDGLISEVTVLVRPLTAAHSLARLVGRRMAEA
ncbi:nuclear transport factor 2 family protein [Micromonospora parathelypteridis]|uniref:Ketosteroid isomerase-like protein n=1 Tax=Micromonospora parathelypteridis TaxID=1839617 RepID=A0A840W898_9ACTN|nr:nuclear transport factor 2 family protein [Micromonospora parathelypteridis]MBB5480970.1 ketosteroid isomerase-like protein [Micromonospora parathelypteridis]GGO20717.1 membrane protein [Micromonospora parathelypteridis]